MVDKLSESLDAITESSGKAPERIYNMSGAISEQFNGVEEINTHVDQIGTNTPLQTAAFEEAAATSYILVDDGPCLLRSMAHIEIVDRPISASETCQSPKSDPISTAMVGPASIRARENFAEQFDDCKEL